jgi:hypothetical protein
MNFERTLLAVVLAASACGTVLADQAAERRLPAVQGPAINQLPAVQSPVDPKVSPAPDPRAPRMKLPIAQRPDITSQGGITIGGKSAPWGGALALTASDAFLHSNGKCAFNVTYSEINLGPVATSPAYANRLRAGATVISQQTGRHLNAGESKTVNTQAYLAPGEHVVSLMLDDGNVVVESNEGNNLFRVKVGLKGRCAGVALPGQTSGQPDLIPVLTDPMSGQVEVRNIGTAAAAPSKLAIQCQKLGHVGGGGGCPEAPGMAAYEDAALPDHAVINIPALPPGASHVHHLAFWPALVFTTGTYQFKAVADATHAVAESNEANNTTVGSKIVP